MAETDPKATIDRVAELMDEYRLSEARLLQSGFGISFRRRPAPKAARATTEAPDSESEILGEWTPPPPAQPAAPPGVAVVSPMNGIFYASPNPGSPPFVRPGDSVSAGQIIGLIEAMKVFNEIPSTVGGTVIEVVAQTSEIVNPGDALLYVEPEA